MDIALMSGIAMQAVVILMLGLASSGHCLAMCGGIAASVSASSAKTSSHRSSNGNKDGSNAYIVSDRELSIGQLTSSLLQTIVFNIGRLISYSLAGALVGTVLSGITQFSNSMPLLRMLAGIVTIVYGLSLLGWRLRLEWFERLTIRFWRLLQPTVGRLLPPKSPWQLLALGMFWGWLPCGMVYSALFYASTAGNALGAAVLMLVFGAGTMPAMVAVGTVASVWRERLQQLLWQRVLGLLVIAMGVLMVVIALQAKGGHGGHHMHSLEEGSKDEHHMHHH